MAKKKTEAPAPVPESTKSVGGKELAAWKTEIMSSHAGITPAEFAEAVKKRAEQAGKKSDRYTKEWAESYLAVNKPARTRTPSQPAANGINVDQLLTVFGEVKALVGAAGSKSKALETLQTLAPLLESAGSVEKARELIEKLA